MGSLENLIVMAKMSHFLENKNQNTCEEANESKLIPSIRWISEAVNV